MDVADEVFAPDAILHLGTDDVQGPEGFKEYVAGYREAFPDIHWAVEDQVAEGDMVVTRLTGTGTHQGELMGIPPTGLQVTVTAIANVRIVGDKIQESWSSWDALGLMQQLGVMPPTATDYTWGPPSEMTGDLGDPVTNTAMVLYFVQKFWNEQNVAGLDNTHSPDLIAHNPVIPGNPLPYNMYKQVGLLHLAAFPDMRVTAENILA
ncbi:MAG: ester cyclase [Sedimentisphaerales bacterium]